MLVIPAFYGALGQPWPEGVFYLVEAVADDAFPLFWTDGPFDKRQWAYIAHHAAGFASAGDAHLAISQRCRPPSHCTRLIVSAHEWAS